MRASAGSRGPESVSEGSGCTENFSGAGQLNSGPAGDSLTGSMPGLCTGAEGSSALVL